MLSSYRVSALPTLLPVFRPCACVDCTDARRLTGGRQPTLYGNRTSRRTVYHDNQQPSLRDRWDLLAVALLFSCSSSRASGGQSWLLWLVVGWS